MEGEQIILYSLMIAGIIIISIQLTFLIFPLGQRIRLREKLKPKIVYICGLFVIISGGLIALIGWSLGYLSGLHGSWRSVGGAWVTWWEINDVVIACWAFSNFGIILFLLGTVTLSFFGLAFLLNSKLQKKWK